MSQVALFLLGPPRIECDGQPVSVDTRKAMALAAYLAVTGERHSRDTLATLFWPQSDQARARAALRRTLSVLKRAVCGAGLEIEQDSLALRPGADLWLDVDRFRHLLDGCQTHGHAPDGVCPACVAPLTEAVDLYCADFMTGFTLRDSPQFDDWQSFTSRTLGAAQAGALQKLVRFYSARQDFELAIAYAWRWLELDPLDELAHYQLMQIYVWTGRRAEALRQYQECAKILEQELGIPLQEEITRLYHAIRENQVPASRLPTVPAHTHNLPQAPTPFVGRAEELGEVARLLQEPGCRLLTVVGPGGTGKTRLALQAASQQAGAFVHGVYFVSLAPLDSPDFLVPAIADSLGLSFHGGAYPKDQLLNYLREKQMLLLLDNYEHLLVEGGPELAAEILRSAPGVKLLVTSRGRLNLQWEWPFELRGLPFPQRGGRALEEYSAVKLFLQSARRADPGFCLSQEERPFVARICKSLEGVPLGIELAASWVLVRSCKEIAREIERNLAFVTSTWRDVPERHRSLQTVFDHSWNLLTDEERGVLIRLSVFRSGFGGRAAEAVAGAAPVHLSALIHKSFLYKSTTGRYDMLEVVRQFARDKLQESARAWKETRDRHCAYYAAFLSERDPVLKEGHQQKALAQIGEEIDNIRAAWRWAVAHRQYAQIHEALDSLCRFYQIRSRFHEGEQAVGRALDTLAGHEDDQTLLVARLRTRRGWFCFKLSNFEESRALLQSSLDLLRPTDAHAEMALALNRLGIATAARGDLDAAEELLQESLALRRQVDDEHGVADCLNNLGLISAIRGDLGEARVLVQQSLAIRERFQNRSDMLDSLGNLGVFAENSGDFCEAKRIHEKCLVLLRALGDRWGLANTLNNLGFAHCALGELSEAGNCFRESLEIGRDLQSVQLTIESLVGIATLMAHGGEQEQAVSLATCALAHPAIWEKPQDRAQELLAELEGLLSPTAFARARATGKMQDLTQLARICSTIR